MESIALSNVAAREPSDVRGVQSMRRSAQRLATGSGCSYGRAHGCSDLLPRGGVWRNPRDNGRGAEHAQSRFWSNPLTRMLYTQTSDNIQWRLPRLAPGIEVNTANLQ
jgi:hypothetical protein